MRFTSKNVKNNVTTFQGGQAKQLNYKQELIKLCLTSFIKNDFYEKYETKIKRIQEACLKVENQFLINLSIWSRNYGLRTVNHIIFVETILKLSGKKNSRAVVKKWINGLIKRPDELMDIIGYFAFRSNQNLNKLVLPNLLKYAVKERLSLFDEYQIAKYKGSGDFNMYDMINITRPKSEAVDKLMKGNLKPADTWEVELSKNGNNKESWQRLISEKKLGALATIRNLKNMSKVGVDYVEQLKRVDFTKIFPFQSIQALDVLDNENLLDSKTYDIIIEKAKDSFRYISENFKGQKVAIGLDVSGSMFPTNRGDWGKVKGLSKVSRAKMAIYYGTLLGELIEDSDIYLWSDSCRKVSKDSSIEKIYQIAEAISGGTSIRSFTRDIENKGYDSAIIITDEQVSDSIQNVVKNKTIIWDISDYNTTIENRGIGVIMFTGFNDICWRVVEDIASLGKLEKYITNLGKND